MKLRDSETDEFLVLACDGVWDVMSNEDICSFVSARMRITDDLEFIANEVIDTCLHKVCRYFCKWGVSQLKGTFRKTDFLIYFYLFNISSGESRQYEHYHNCISGRT